MSTLSQSRLHVVTGSSLYLRDHTTATLLGSWQGPIKRQCEPNDPARLVLDLDTPSLFEDPAAWVIRCDGKWLKKHAEILLPLVGTQAVAGLIVLSVSDMDKSKAGGEAFTALTKALKKHAVLHESDEPDSKMVVNWLSDRLAKHAQKVENPRLVAEALVEHLGDDIDALLNAVDVVAIYAGDKPLSTDAVHAVIVGQAGRPIWEFTAAVLEGKCQRALELLQAGGGINPQQAITALTSEVRKLFACLESNDDAEVAEWIGSRGKPNLYYARQRAKLIGQANLQRLLTGCLQTQRQLRQTGSDNELALETLVLHARRVVRPAGR
jgi:DNA polymerase III delta subunit